ncbi:MAG TPA: TPM domain-containing protein, partial [Stellaceae bacterium]|nr:TPM domain-containing protein [Stellaceae bacterium]
LRRRRRVGELVMEALGADDRARIHAAKAAVEQRTAAELAVVVVPVSDRYPFVGLVWAAAAAFGVAVIVALVAPDLEPVEALAIQAVALVLFALLFDWMPVRLRLAPRHLRHARARQLAHREFAAHVVSGGAHRNRVLLFVSLGERYVEIIADRGTHNIVPEGTWDRIVAEFLAKVKAGAVADGVLAAVAACGQVLETHHPPAR